jgi:hypothetical protein
VKIQSTAEKDVETQNRTGGQQHVVEKKDTQGALPHSQKRRKMTLYKERQKQR